MPYNGMEYCHICGLEGARRHYQGLACQRCRVFFIRTVSQAKSYVCQKNSKCYPRNGRFSCSYCRYQHCLMANMQPNEVKACQKKKMKVEYFNKDTMLPHLSGYYQSSMMSKKSLSPIPMNFPIENIHFIVQLDRSLANTTGPSPYFYDSLCSVEASLEEVLLSRKKCSARDLAFFHLEPIHGPSTSFSSVNLSNPYCRMISYCAELASFANEFRELVITDQVKLFQSNCIEIGLLSYLYGNWMAKVNTVTEEAETQPNNMPFFLDDETIFSFEVLFFQLQLSEAEAFLLKMIHLFQAQPSYFPSSMSPIFKARDSYTHFLWDYLRFTSPSENTKHLSARMGKILSLLYKIQELGIAVRQRLALMAVAEKHGLKGQLSFDIHFKDYEYKLLYVYSQDSADESSTTQLQQ